MPQGLARVALFAGPTPLQLVDDAPLLVPLALLRTLLQSFHVLPCVQCRLVMLQSAASPSLFALVIRAVLHLLTLRRAFVSGPPLLAVQFPQMLSFLLLS